ncbi:DUF6101 family protein [Phreatobacter stygius]|uniref:DUF6101 family protein n=1 Tax=Phreatobacter stygius TaxID=1940610 RepID=UPI001FEAD5C0|nr:DUF6101 family protein [Phreatobacter stygius]
MCLDPTRLPARYSVPDEGTDSGDRSIDLFDDRLVIRRTVGGARMKLQLPVTAYRGVAVRIGDGAIHGTDKVEVVLAHGDPSLNVPLFVATDGDDVVAQWQLWARRFALPLLVIEPDGAIREAFERLGQVVLGRPGPRRRRHSALRARRPMALMRRKAGGAVAGRAVHREREIIARS